MSQSFNRFPIANALEDPTISPAVSAHVNQSACSTNGVTQIDQLMSKQRTIVGQCAEDICLKPFTRHGGKTALDEEKGRTNAHIYNIYTHASSTQEESFREMHYVGLDLLTAGVIVISV